MDEEAKDKHGTRSNKYDDFPVGTHVKVICVCQDHHFFWGETGTVIKNTGSYLGICVKFDEPRQFTDGSVQETFGFNPDDLIIIDNKEENALLKDQIEAAKELIADYQDYYHEKPDVFYALKMIKAKLE